MNERIKELIEQATTRKWRGDGTDSIPKEEFDKEKFAELIARDCMNAIRQEWFNENNIILDQDARSIAIHLGKKLGIESALHAVTKQFGVEE